MAYTKTTLFNYNYAAKSSKHSKFYNSLSLRKGFEFSKYSDLLEDSENDSSSCDELSSLDSFGSYKSFTQLEESSSTFEYLDYSKNDLNHSIVVNDLIGLFDPKISDTSLDKDLRDKTEIESFSTINHLDFNEVYNLSGLFDLEYLDYSDVYNLSELFDLEYLDYSDVYNLSELFDLEYLDYSNVYSLSGLFNIDDLNHSNVYHFSGLLGLMISIISLCINSFFMVNIEYLDYSNVYTMVLLFNIYNSRLFYTKHSDASNIYDDEYLDYSDVYDLSSLFDIEHLDYSDVYNLSSLFNIDYLDYSDVYDLSTLFDLQVYEQHKKEIILNPRKRRATFIIGCENDVMEITGGTLANKNKNKNIQKYRKTNKHKNKNTDGLPCCTCYLRSEKKPYYDIF